MNEEHDKFDDLMREMMLEGGLEQAPSNFTQAVMGQIATQSSKAKRTEKPLISRWGWIGIAASVVTTTIIGLVAAQPSHEPLPGQLQAEAAVDGFMGFFSGIQFPIVLVMSAVAFTLLFTMDRLLHRRLKGDN